MICKACYALVQEEEERATIAKYVAGAWKGGGEGGNSSCGVCRARRSWTTRVRCGGSLTLSQGHRDRAGAAAGVLPPGGDGGGAHPLPPPAPLREQRARRRLGRRLRGTPAPFPAQSAGRKKQTDKFGRAMGGCRALCAQEAGKVEASLVELFKNFDIGVKKITAMKFESEKVGSHLRRSPQLPIGWLGHVGTRQADGSIADMRGDVVWDVAWRLQETRVQNSVKMALIGFLQENLARFRTLQNVPTPLPLQPPATSHHHAIITGPRSGDLTSARGNDPPLVKKNSKGRASWRSSSRTRSRGPRGSPTANRTPQMATNTVPRPRPLCLQLLPPPHHFYVHGTCGMCGRVCVRLGSLHRHDRPGHVPHGESLHTTRHTMTTTPVDVWAGEAVLVLTMWCAFALSQQHQQH